VKARYGYIWDVKRIFADKGNNPVRQDFDSNSHIVNISYQTSLPTAPQIVVFGYLLDFNNDSPSPAIVSSNPYGFRTNGCYEFDQDWGLDYILSYAYQIDSGDNPIDYDAHYVGASLDVGYAPLGRLGIWVETTPGAGRSSWTTTFDALGLDSLPAR